MHPVGEIVLQDALIVFDVNVPKPRSNNCVTLEGFYNRLNFDAELVEIEASMKKANDRDLLMWVIREIANPTGRHKPKRRHRYTFFVTKDGDFDRDSSFYRCTANHLRADARIVIINIPAYKEIEKLAARGKTSKQRQVLRRKELLDIIIDKLNSAWRNRSPR